MSVVYKRLVLPAWLEVSSALSAFVEFAFVISYTCAGMVDYDLQDAGLRENNRRHLSGIRP